MGHTKRTTRSGASVLAALACLALSAGGLVGASGAPARLGTAATATRLPVAFTGAVRRLTRPGNAQGRPAATAARATTWSQQAEITETAGQQYDYFGSAVTLSAGTALVGAFGRDGLAGAAYTFACTGTPCSWTPQTEITATDGQQGDYFGYAAAVSGGTAVVGAWGRPGTDTGRAYVFTRTGSTWSQQAELTASDGQAGDDFGKTVAIGTGTIVIGAPYKNQQAGAAYIFARNRTTGVWSQQAEITATDGQPLDTFGQSVAISGTTVVVGAPYATGNTGGAAYVYVRSGAAWTEQARLVAGDGQSGGRLGDAVALDGSTAVIGADGKNNGTGAAYVFGRSGTTWNEQAELTASDGQSGDEFGGALAVSGSTTVIGALGKNSATGAAYIFAHNRTTGTWAQQAEIVARDGQPTDFFGDAVAISGGTALVGASGQPGFTTSAGAAYMFTRTRA